MSGSLGKLWLCACALAPVSAHADPAPQPQPETIIVIDHKPDPDAAPAARDRTRALGDAPFVTVVHPDEHPATASVADALGQSVGVQTQSLGGLGAYESISVRGQTPGQTEVLVDGVPLARIAAVTTDLGSFALGAFGEVDLYRGAVPVELGGAGVGGAVDLVTRLGPGEHGERVTASLGAGSFGARHLRLHYGDAHAGGRVLSSTTIGYEGATGDYTYFSDNGTPLNRNDDSYLVRENDAFDQIDASSRVGAADGHAAGGVRAAWKRQGLPGSASQPALDATLETLDLIADARGDADVGPATARERGWLLVEDQRLRDPMGELGAGAQDRAYLTLSGGASTTWHAPLGRHRATAGVELRADRFRDRDTTGATGELVGDRVGGAALAAVDLAVDRGAAVVVTPAIRFDLVRTAPTPTTAGPSAGMPVAPRWDAIPSPRLTARAAVASDVALKGSAGWYVREPTLIELFGDRGTILGSPELRPERGPSAELGAVWAPSRALGAVDRVLVEADGFATRAQDTIALVASGGYTARAMNLGDSSTWGGELVGSARLARTLSLTASYTHLATEQLTGEVSYAHKALPRQPGDALYARADVAHVVLGRRAAAWLDASWQAESFLDPANLQRVPARLLVGAGARVELGAGLAVAASVANLTDVRVVYLPLVPPPRPDLTQTPTAVADLAGFPLPGRSFYVTLEWSR